jgi:ribosome-associated protein YbcJ (S4-like RNA binding protein)
MKHASVKISRTAYEIAKRHADNGGKIKAVIAGALVIFDQSSDTKRAKAMAEAAKTS